MDHTNCGENCSFVKSGFCKCDRECPFYVETWWQLEGKPDPKLVKDCFPKKFALEQNHLLHRQLCLQQGIEEVRNRLDSLETMLKNLISVSKEYLQEKREEKNVLQQVEFNKISYKDDP